MEQLVFVYGSLRQGAHCHERMAGAHFLGFEQTPPIYAFYSLGLYPAAVEGGNQRLLGEIYRVNPLQLELLDQFERYPDLYQRSRIPSRYGHSWIYTMPRPPADGRLLGHGDWLLEI
ncbi:gamma-glutamylcyclotransferase family protein [Aestuariirhabdus litorea]|uniref:Gamma-glutamylcyclotransferase family protein n=1 Tax=Aestuariirhabdus litorea TaxID=2528527 RepID=A0A3P3VS01_9GAMM|nr:gamma-glutamylcyclotransferase family protein [Aestuariirhabdus litorea]RRJ84289.1 gamma-glutamylcyclotransferase [Aestuariirhabdus litorea]RWW97512.1 gamma-glutamylcyclotransferase [Endozoicomonadaceae bacterium GTF-13]